MKVKGYLLQDEGDIENFLGVNITAREDGKYEMLQSGLINDITEDLGLNRSSTKFERHKVPATEVLHPDLDKPEFNKEWSYRSVIGKLNFLAMNSRPDVAFAVHQCARFCSNPRASHGAAVKRIGRYLKASADKGLIFCPEGDNSIHAYCDADFAGTWTKETSHLKSLALSRTGFVILYSGCPIVWHSKLQTEIALSTCEAEYIALSQCARVLIPLRRLLEEIAKIFTVCKTEKSLCNGSSNILYCLGKSVILEDNQSCVALANDKSGKNSTRTRHISVKWHHFREQISKGWLSVHKVDTKRNWSDIFTKPLPRVQFEILRNQLMGRNESNSGSAHLELDNIPINQSNKENIGIIDLYNPYQPNCPVAVAALAFSANKKRQAFLPKDTLVRNNSNKVMPPSCLKSVKTEVKFTFETDIDNLLNTIKGKRKGSHNKGSRRKQVRFA